MTARFSPRAASRRFCRPPTDAGFLLVVVSALATFVPGCSPERALDVVAREVVPDDCASVSAAPAACLPGEVVPPGDCAARRRLGRVERGAQGLREMLMAERFDEIEALVNELVASRTRTRDGHHYPSIVLRRTLEPPLQRPELLPKLDTWVEERPKSALARIFRARYHGLMAWQVRGGDWAGRVPERAWKQVEESLELMRVDLAEARRLEPTHLLAALVHLWHARLLDTDCAEMEQLYQEVVAVDPDISAAQAAKLTFLMPKWGRTGSEERVFEYARAMARCSPRGSLAPFLVVQAHDDRASHAGREEATREPDQPSPATAGRHAYLSRDAVWAEITAAMERLMSDFPESAEWPTAFARMARRAGKASEAERLLQEAIRRDPELPFAHLEHGRFLEWTVQDIEGALAAYQRVLELDPFSDDAWKRRGYLLFKGKRHAEAETAYLHVAELDPFDHKAAENLAKLAYWRNDYPLMIERYTRAIEIDPEEPEYYQARGYAHIKLGHYQEAVDDSTKAIELKPDMRSAYMNRAHALGRLGRLEERQRDKEMLERLSP